MNIQRGIQFLRRRLFAHPLYTITYGMFFFSKNFTFPIHLYTPEEVIEHVKKGKSLIRLGDGEMSTIPLGLKNAYQTPGRTIKKMLHTIVRKYSSDSPYILSVPRFLTVPNTELRMMGKLHVWLPTKVMFLLRFDKHVPYMDAHNFYYDNYFEGVIAPILKDKRIICITNKKTIEKQRKNPNLPWKDVLYVESPEYDALDAYGDMTSAIDREIQKYDKKDVVILVAVGPIGKYLVYEYANRGYQGLDIGKVAEVMFTGESIQYMI